MGGKLYGWEPEKTPHSSLKPRQFQSEVTQLIQL